MSKINLLSGLVAVLLVLGGCESPKGKSELTQQTDYTKYVNPYIGTGFHGHVFLGANVPFGAVQLGPVNFHEGWDWCSGYHYNDSTLIGFAHTHLSGTGIGDLGDILVMPVCGDYKMALGTPDSLSNGYMALYSHSDEQVKPGYYSVDIHRYGIKAELTATTRTGVHRYTFSRGDLAAHLIFNLDRGIGWDHAVMCKIHQVNDTLITGYRFSSGWAKDQREYFAAVFNHPIQSIIYSNGIKKEKGDSLEAVHLMADLNFGQLKGNKLGVRIGISAVSSTNALLNLEKETDGKNFDSLVASAHDLWQKELGRVEGFSPDSSVLVKFYTALYHTFIAPSVFQDVNGEYRGSDGKIYKDTTFTNYTTFSLWDTYRAAHPMYTLLQPKRVTDFVQTMIHISEQQGQLPVWHLMGNETFCMVGNSAVPVIADACLKGIGGFSLTKAYQAMRTTQMGNDRRLNDVKKLGFIPANTGAESVASGLEYAVDDAALAKVAILMKNDSDASYFSKRGKYYKNYYDPSVGFMRGRFTKDKWRTPFDPFKAKHRQDDFCEGNSWQYTWLVPQDVPGLIHMLGGRKAFLKKLDQFFTAHGDMGPLASNDITGLIGQYAHGNEPSHHIAYLYALAGESYKTDSLVRVIMKRFYTVLPDGLIGNEDVGQMSAWYVLSAMGIYQVDPAGGDFVIGSPELSKAVIHLPKGKEFTIEAKNNASDKYYVKAINLNGSSYDKRSISYSTIMHGGTLTLQMDSHH